LHVLNNQVLALLPALRAYARLLTRDASDADDLLQEALMRAIGHLHQFEPGTNLKAWLFTILRNTHFTAAKKRLRERRLRAGVLLDTAGERAGQGWSLSARRVGGALDKLPAEQRDVLLLVCGAGFSYEEAAAITGCAMGTVKSRINRGRRRLSELLGIESVADLAGDSAGVLAPPVAEAREDQ
jgi:RNA polymerase sigma-70 factor (ECF subfamily)